jgi:hypothetical protein
LTTPDRNAPPGARRRPARSCAGIALALLSLAILLSSGCAVQLAPSYDTTIVDGLTSANEQAMTFFASVSSGTEDSPFSDREKTYDELIGKFGALRVQALARPTPQPLILDYLGLAPSAATASEPENRLKAPTADILATIIDKLTRMRDKDKSGSLTKELVALFENSYELSITQALAYEKALQR